MVLVDIFIDEAKIVLKRSFYKINQGSAAFVKIRHNPLIQTLVSIFVRSNSTPQLFVKKRFAIFIGP